MSSLDDGSGETQLEDGILNTDDHLQSELGATLTGQTLASVTGVVRYAYGSFEVHPRDASDIVVSVSGTSHTVVHRGGHLVQMAGLERVSCSMPAIIRVHRLVLGAPSACATDTAVWGAVRTGGAFLISR